MTETFWDRHGLYGLMAQFETPEQVISAAQRAYDAGYRKMDAYSPMPVEGLGRSHRVQTKLGFARSSASAACAAASEASGCCGGSA